MDYNNMAQPNNYYNYGAFNYGVNPAGGMTYGQPMNIPANNLLPEETIKELLANGNGNPQIKFTIEDQRQALCCHRYNGQNMTYPLPNGKVKCKICNAEFNLIEDATNEDIQKATDNIHDLMHTAKMLWLNVPQKMGTEFFSTLMAIDKIPVMFNIASDQFNRYMGTQPLMQQAGYPVNGFGMFNQIIGGPNMMMYQSPQQQAQITGYDMYGNPIYGNPNMMYQNTQQPIPNTNVTMQQAQMTSAAPGVSNGMGYTVPNLTAPPAEPITPSAPVVDNNTNGSAVVTQTLHV